MGKVEIYNRALNLLGLDPISSVLEENKRARTLNLVFDMVLEELLIEEQWSFATKRASLARLTDTTQVNCTYEYQYPADCLKLNRVYTPTDVINAQQYVRPYEIIGDRICSDYESLIAEYIKVPSDVSLYFTGFKQCLAYKLAIECCYQLINSTSREEALTAKYERIILPKAISLDAQQVDPIEEVNYLLEIGTNSNASNVGGR